MMTDEPLVHLVKSRGMVLLDDHFVLTSGRHAPAYVNKDRLYPYVEDVSTVAYLLAEDAHRLDCAPNVVIGPALGGIILSQWVAHHLHRLTGADVLSVYAEKDPTGSGFVIKRGYDQLVVGQRVLIVEDVVTTGGSIKQVAQAVDTAGGLVVGVAAICNRGGITAEAAGVPLLIALLNLSLETWEAADCPLCAQGRPVNTTVGTGREFLARQAALKPAP